MKKFLFLSMFVFLSTQILFAAPSEKMPPDPFNSCITMHHSAPLRIMIQSVTFEVNGIEVQALQKEAIIHSIDFVTPKIKSMFFDIPEVDAKYFNKNGDADPVIEISIQYKGKLSGVPLPIADKVFEKGGHIALKANAGKTDDPPKTDTKKADVKAADKDKPV